MASTRGERLRAARSKLFRSARAAAKALDVAVSTYGAHERAETPGGRDYGPDEARRYARRFKVTPEWLLTGSRAGPMPAGAEEHRPFEAEAPDEAGHLSTVKVVGYVGAGAETHYYAVAQGDLDEVPAPEGSIGATVAVEIRGDSLGSLFDRWLVFYDEVRSPVTPDLIGKLCVVGLADDRVLIKKMRQGSREGLYRLLSEREPPIEDVAVEWAAKVKNMVPR
jgi:hypothetical protein